MRFLKRALSLAVPAAASAVLLSSPTTAAAASPVALAPVTTTVVSPAALSQVCYGALPSQAHTTIDLINQGGPFPFPQDGQVFQNREHVLPSAPLGTYHEYTVITPGSSDRGARRIVTGRTDDYYTADHYVTFRIINYSC